MAVNQKNPGSTDQEEFNLPDTASYIHDSSPTTFYRGSMSTEDLTELVSDYRDEEAPDFEGYDLEDPEVEIEWLDRQGFETTGTVSLKIDRKYVSESVPRALKDYVPDMPLARNLFYAETSEEIILDSEANWSETREKLGDLD